MSPDPDASTNDDAEVAPEEHAVLYAVADHGATITLNRPHRRNATSVPMLVQLGEAFTRADDDRDVRPIVVTGAGKGFCSGLDRRV